MPSRRQVLAGIGVLGMAGMSGCLTHLGVAETGFLSYKGINVVWRHHGQPMSARLCWVWSNGQDRLFGWVADEYRSLVHSATDIRLTKEIEARLRERFIDVTLHLGFSHLGATDHDLLEGDWYTALVSRRDFNRIQFGDQAEVLFRFPRVHLIDVYDGTQGDVSKWEHELGTMDFTALYRD